MRLTAEQEELMAHLDSEAAAHLEGCGEPRVIPNVQTAPSPRRWRSAWVLSLAGALCLAVLVWMPRHQSPYRALQVNSPMQSPAARAESPAPPTPMIVRTAQLNLTTAKFDKARNGIEDILKRHQGYFGELSVAGSAGSGRTLDATIRVPADHREAVLAELKKLGRVDSESQGGEEVTAQYVDLEARLSNAKNTEQRLIDVLRQRTGKLSDVLAVEQEIGRVRGEIEQMEAQKKTLTNRVDFASLTVKVTEDYDDPARTRFRKAAADGYRTMIGGLLNVGLFLAAYGPSLLLWGGLLYFPLRFAWKRVIIMPIWRAK